MDERELFALVRKNYGEANREYLKQQVMAAVSHMKLPSRKETMDGLLDWIVLAGGCGMNEKYRQFVYSALSLLKEQEPRVMTWDEMVEAGKSEIPIYIEENPKGDPVRDFWGFALPGIEPPEDKPFNYPGGVDFNAMNSDGEIWDGDFYGMNAPLGWRAWSARPTEEQMRDTPWEGDKDEEPI